ncbi:uncharacterized protein MELLADRAFT_124483 [Melampsora larici-populina 98AG31]|uniref:Secreted protein n=1 Tax=Melampsora larici-populina (strain 98AG31 / pathotype 3-4-7) TaxID=747676 RepID=F4RU84_MELLP|nr:uncharacterized protein MELLADRAFT_124483 [Melampsora larici-populina 98AG31]EGG04045.1 secreted protein [Melampsora larici-populina 98AG31]
MMSQRYFKLLVVFLGLFAMIASIAEGRGRHHSGNGGNTVPKPKLPMCGNSKAKCTKGVPGCPAGQPSCGEKGKFQKCSVEIKCQT